jgi:primosomal protein N' (replication factor Y) (superfamily II helicase)
MGLVERFTREVRRGGPDEAPGPPEPPRVLHAHQQAAFEAIAAQIRACAYGTFLLHGVTGSGKTEVYVAALREALEAGRTGLVLVPEIALTPQTVRRFRAPFGDRVAVVHSRMSNGERYDVWRSIREGRYPIVIGPRSAIFAPVDNLGLVVVDEEHEASYKQFDPAPRYHARDVAVVRARLNGAVCVLGSATPSLESWHNAHAGKYRLLSMPKRVPLPGGETAKLPPVEVVDLARERKRHRLDGALSEALVAAIGPRVAKGEGVILLQNRRGYAPVVECRSCGWTPRCRHCAVTLTYHKAKAHLRCHYCGYAIRRPAACASCGEADLAFQGVGTQRVEEELAMRFPGLRVVRMDLDTTGTKGAHARLLDRFAAGEADVLLGTQMVAKGLDFARVTLVGVVNADSGLLLPDFRAAERTFQLLTQVAGRAGRAEAPGAVIFQTRTPDNPAITFAQRHDYAGFARRELQEREMLGYPPFGRVVAAEFRGYDEAATHAFARQWTDTLIEMAGSAVEVLGPQPALVGRVQRLYRVHTVLKVPAGAPPVQPLLRRVVAACPAPSRIRVALDVDAMGVF